MDYIKLEHFVSQPRLNRFLIACGNSKTKAQELYKINLKISQEIYPSLNLFEIFLRNAINEQISLYFSDQNWIINQKNNFMSDPSLSASIFQMRNSVQKAENLIRKKGSSITSGKVIAEQTFGFWTSIFESHHYRLVGGAPIKGFPNKPNGANRNVINKKLNEIRVFRNRIYHNEPICFLNQAIDFANVQYVVQTIDTLLNWTDPDLVTYANQFNNIQAQIIAGNNL